MVYWALLISAVLLSLERITYVGIARRPQTWRGLCARPGWAWFGTPVVAVRRLFVFFKILQIAIFVVWCIVFSGDLVPMPTGSTPSLAFGGLLLAIGQLLNVSVFYRLGGSGVFFGAELGDDVPWVSGFPFAVLKHPQYIGTVLSIWGFFLVMRFPHDDWYWLPVLETVFYAVGASQES